MVPSLFVAGLIGEDLGQQKLQARYIAGALRDANLSARVIDLNDGIEAIVAHVRAAFPRLIVSSLLFADRVDEHLALMTALRAADIRAHLTIAGHLPMFTYAELLRACPALDSVLCGEAETIALHHPRGRLANHPWCRIAFPRIARSCFAAPRHVARRFAAPTPRRIVGFLCDD